MLTSAGQPACSCAPASLDKRCELVHHGVDVVQSQRRRVEALMHRLRQEVQRAERAGDDDEARPVVEDRPECVNHPPRPEVVGVHEGADLF
jgi:hypothetical protein